ncbi:MAG TPA: EamA family transporter [Bryobacteraceae bacterium]|nr:EamA family transporter [Bryobacteraceae bacterium]
MLLPWLLVATIIVCTALGDLLQSIEMKRHGEVRLEDGRVGRLLKNLARRKYLILAVFLMALSFFAFMKLLAVADLSFSVPATAGSFVLETLLAKLVLGESVDWRRWTGAFLVACGVALLAW